MPPIRTISSYILPLGLFVASAPLTLRAQTATPAPPVHHHAAAATANKPHPRTHATPPAETGPALPPGVPAAPGKVETAFALRYIDVKSGEGDPVQSGQYITVQYTGWLASNGIKFDSSLDHPGAAAFTFPQGMHRVISGWDQGFSGMKAGGKRRLFIPYQLAYGDEGRPPVIPAKSDLIFDIELISASSTPPAPAAPVAP